MCVRSFRKSRAFAMTSNWAMPHHRLHQLLASHCPQRPHLSWNVETFSRQALCVEFLLLLWIASFYIQFRFLFLLFFNFFSCSTWEETQASISLQSIHEVNPRLFFLFNLLFMLWPLIRYDTILKYTYFWIHYTLYWCFF